MRFGTWNVSSLYREGSTTATARELARYKSELVGGQNVRWAKQMGVIIFPTEMKMVNWEHDFLYTTEQNISMGCHTLF
jgi:hypothetical protein